MTFKGMLKILINDYRKQHEEKLFSIVQELMKTRRELREVREQLRCLQSDQTFSTSTDSEPSVPTISLYVQYNGFFNQLCDLRQTTTIEELFVQLRQLAGIPSDRPLHLRVLGEDSGTTLFFLHHELHRTLESYQDCLKPGMIISIEDCEEVANDEQLPSTRSAPSNERTYSFDESDV